MDLAAAARSINHTAYGYISSWALLTASELQLFDLLPATASELSDKFPDADLVDTWMHVLAGAGIVEQDQQGRWSQSPEMARMLVGDQSYSGYLGGQVLQQLAPRLTLGVTGENVLRNVLRDPDIRTGYEGWFSDAEEARTYQQSQFAGSLGPAKAIAAALPNVAGRVLDIGGGWGAIARAVAKQHDVDVDVVDFATVIDVAPDAGPNVHFIEGNALDATSWPTHPDGETYDGAVFSYLFSSIPGDEHELLLESVANTDVRWIAIHDFMVGSGTHASAWSLQHAVFVPGHRSRTADEIRAMLGDVGFAMSDARPLIDEMTTLVVATR